MSQMTARVCYGSMVYHKAMISFFFFQFAAFSFYSLQPELLAPLWQAGCGAPFTDGWVRRYLFSADCCNMEDISQQLSWGIKHPWLFGQETGLWLCTAWLGSILRVKKRVSHRAGLVCRGRAVAFIAHNGITCSGFWGYLNCV